MRGHPSRSGSLLLVRTAPLTLTLSPAGRGDQTRRSVSSESVELATLLSREHVEQTMLQVASRVEQHPSSDRQMIHLAAGGVTVEVL